MRYLFSFFMFLGVCMAYSLCGCDDNNPTCVESACRPGWSGDCWCQKGAHMQMQANGTVLCVCDTKDYK